MKLLTLLLLSAAPSVLLGADRIAVGLTQTKTPIEAVSVQGSSSAAPTVLIVGGLDDEKTADVVAREFERYAALKKRPYQLIAISKANPNKVHLVFPPTGKAYQENTESNYLWRWIGTRAPDLVLVAADEDYGL